MKIGIVGPPQSGKTSLFRLLTGEEKHNVATVPLPDKRLGVLAALFNPPKVTPINVTFVDGPSKGELDGMDGILYIVRPSQNVEKWGQLYFSPNSTDRKIESTPFFPQRPGLVVVNIDEADLDKGKYKTMGLEVCVKDELELLALAEDERAAFMQELGVKEIDRERIIASAYEASDWVSFFTYAGERELRAWPIPRGTKAKEAAGRVHKDMERGFIRAEIVRFADLERAGSIHKAKSEGHLLLEGKDYVLGDGDIVTFRFSV